MLFLKKVRFCRRKLNSNKSGKKKNPVCVCAHAHAHICERFMYVAPY